MRTSVCHRGITKGPLARQSRRRRILPHALLLLLLCVGGRSALAEKTQGNQPIQPSQTFEGTLIVVWGDPRPGAGAGGETRFSLAMADGRLMPLQMAGQDPAAINYFGRRVTVSGRVVPNPVVGASTPDTEAIRVDTIALSPARQGDQNAAEGVAATRRVIFLLLKFSDDAAVPHPPAFFTDLTNPDTPPAGQVFPATINAFFKKTSWNQFNWIGDVGGVGGVGASGGWLTLPHPKSYYAPCGWSGSCANLSAIATDGLALGRAQGITFTTYDNVNFVLSNDLDCCAWGGSYYSSVDGKSYGATWEPPWGQETGTYSHEMGHSIGLPHSGWVYYAYDSPWDLMSNRRSATTVACGSYASVNDGTSRTLYCTEPGDDFIAAHKDYLGWIPAANQVVANTGVTVTLEPGTLPLGSGIKMLKICIPGFSCTGSTARYFTVEARVKGSGSTSQFDNGIPGEGIIIHSVQRNRPSIGGSCFFNSQSGWALPVDSTPGDYDSGACSAGGRTFPNYALFNAQWSPGTTYTNSTYGVSIRVLSRTGSSFEVSLSAFTDDPLIAGSSVVRAIHVSELRARIDALRVRFWLLPFTWSDPAITAGATTIRAQHILDLRQALREAYVARGIGTPPAYTDPILGPGITLRVLHIAELRAAVVAIE